MIALTLLLAVPLVMWIVQSIVLPALGLPLRARIDSSNAPAAVRTAGRITTQSCLLAVLCAYPHMRGQGILSYYAALLPPTSAFLDFIRGAAASILALCLLFLAWLAVDRIEVYPHHSRRKTIKRLVLLIPTALFGGFVEELLFRGVVMADLMEGPRIQEVQGSRVLSSLGPSAPWPLGPLAIIAISATKDSSIMLP